MEALEKHFQLSDKQKSQFAQLQELYEYWNAQINVISRKDLDNFYERHVLHSLGIAKVCRFADGTKILDVGTGGGFPGIPLAILFPEVTFKLIDSIGKKVKVVNEVAAAIDLPNISFQHMRAEEERGKYDFVVSRAVTRMNKFIPWIRKNINTENQNALSNGILYLKGGDLEEEMSEINYPWLTFELSDYFEGEFFETKKVVHVSLA